DEVVDGGSQTQHERDPERTGDDRGVALRRAAGQGDAADELAPDRGHQRGVEIMCHEDRRLPIAIPELRLWLAPDVRGDPPTHVPDVGRPLAEIRVVDRCETL